MWHQHPDPPLPTLLCARRERRRDHRASEETDEFALLYLVGLRPHEVGCSFKTSRKRAQNASV
jgi:hypothetical protein